MEESIDLKQENKKLLAQVKVLEQELSQYQASGPIGFYYELNRWQNDINEYMKVQRVAALVGSDDKDKKFERVLKLIEQSKENVTTIESLKTILGIIGNEDEQSNKKVNFIDKLAIKRIL